MRRMMLVFCVAAIAMLLASGATLAANQIECPNRDGDRCIGTPGADEMDGSRGTDVIRGRGGADLITGRGGSDEIHGELGDDRVVAARCGLPQGAEVFGGRGDDEITVTSDCGDLAVVPPPDKVDCGPGYDVVRGVNPGDRVAPDCERVMRQRPS